MDKVYNGVSALICQTPCPRTISQELADTRPCKIFPCAGDPVSESVPHFLPLQIWLGNVIAARDLQSLSNVGVTHVLNCAALQCPSFYPQVCVHVLRVNAADPSQV